MRWHKVNDKKPETYPQVYVTVPIWHHDHWDAGWWSGRNWLLVETKRTIENVTHWAEVEPPTEHNTITE